MRILKLLSLKLFLIIFVIMSILTISFSLYNLAIELNHYETVTQKCADRVSAVVLGSLQDAMLENRKPHIARAINAIVEHDGIKKISLVNRKGKVAYSTDPSELNTYFRMDNPICSPCHLADGKLKRFDKELFYNITTSASGERRMNRILPINNNRSCSEADCHAHHPEEKILGIIRVVIPLGALDKAIDEHKTFMLTANISLTLIMGLIVGLFIWFFVHVPVARLIRGTKEISSGNLEHQISLQREDEIGLLAESFNEMTRDLKAAKQEITEWSGDLENRVKEKTRELEKSQRRNLQIEKMASLGQLSATVAHELNNPIAGILTYSKLIQKKLEKRFSGNPENEEITRYLKMIESESQRSGEIVKNLLLFSRQGNLEKKRTNINQIIESALELVQHHLQLHNIQLNRQFQKDIPEFEADPNLLKQSFIALFVNAVEAMEDEGILTVKTNRLDDEDAVNITVMDNGKGIPPEILPNIFEPFFTTKNAVKGVGLGLSSVFAIVEKHDGIIAVESKVNVGTTFKMKLPIKGKEKK